MPTAWLLQLLERIRSSEDDHDLETSQKKGHPELLALFRTCKVLRDLVLSQCTLLLNYRLPIAPDQQAAAQDKLLRACRLSPKVDLCFSSALHEFVASSSASSLMFDTLAAAGHGLGSISSVTLTRLELNAVVPSWLAATCPNMTSLDLNECHTLPSANPSVTGNVSTLSIWFGQSEVGKQPAAMQGWKKHLSGLPGLTSLDIDGYSPPAWLFECCASIGAQLTRLFWGGNMEPASLAQLPGWYPHIREVHLGGTVVDDQGLHALLSMQQLQRLQCWRFQLEHSYTHRPCTWQHLEIGYLDIPDFDRLPLAGVHTMKGDEEDGMTITPSPGDLGAASRVAATLARCGGIITRRLTLSNWEAHASTPSLVAAMEVAAQCQTRDFNLLDNILPMTAELLEAIKHHLPSIGATRLNFNQCTLSPELWPLLLATIPPAIRDVTWSSSWSCVESQMTEAQVTAMCAHACCPIDIRVCNRRGMCTWEPGWEQRVQAAMAAAGHQHVSLSFNSY